MQWVMGRRMGTLYLLVREQGRTNKARAMGKHQRSRAYFEVSMTGRRHMHFGDSATYPPSPAIARTDTTVCSVCIFSRIPGIYRVEIFRRSCGIEGREFEMSTVFIGPVSPQKRSRPASRVRTQNTRRRSARDTPYRWIGLPAFALL